MSKRTPGPYTLDPATPPAIYEENSPSGHIVCLFNAEWRPAEENLANAEFFHLAASVHDELLKALNGLRSDGCFCDIGDGNPHTSGCLAAQRAVAKAEGK